MGRALKFSENGDELERYRTSYAKAVRREISINELTSTAEIGHAHEALRWICYYIRNVEEGKDPGPEWRRDTYEPCLKRLREIRRRDLS